MPNHRHNAQDNNKPQETFSYRLQVQQCTPAFPDTVRFHTHIHYYCNCSCRFGIIIITFYYYTAIENWPPCNVFTITKRPNKSALVTNYLKESLIWNFIQHVRTTQDNNVLIATHNKHHKHYKHVTMLNS